MSSRRLRRELLDDPLGQGYSGLSDAECLTLITDATARPAPELLTISGGELYNLIDDAELLALPPSEQLAVSEMYGIDTIIVGPGSRARAKLNSVLTAIVTPKSRQNLIDRVINRTQSRADELGIRGDILSIDGIAACRMPDQPPGV